MKTFSIELSEQEINLVLQSLAELPFKMSAPMIQKIHTAVQAQMTPVAEAVPQEAEAISEGPTKAH